MASMSEDQALSGAQTPVEDEALVESLIKGRGKRSTAGRHMSALLNAEADDDLALLFEEVDDDNEFDVAVDDEDEDMRLDSSSDDDEDHGPNAKDDEDAGEKEIEKEAKAERKKRRAKDDLRLKALRKKVKIDPTVSTVPPPRPKKKSERISWLPTPDEGPTRSSSRRQTMQNKELTHARLKDSEERRIRLIATMEEAAKRKAHFKPKEWTQTEWLAEAERVERLNSKSLNRWEEAEKRKADERRAKIEALQNRRLEGPVMSYWSGIATWVDGRLTQVGKARITNRPKPEKEEPARRRSKKVEKEEKSVEEPKPAEVVNVDAVPSQLSLPAPVPENATPTIAPDQRAVMQNENNLENKQVDSNSVPNSDKLPEEGPSNDRPGNRTTPVTATENPVTETPTPIGTGTPPDTVATPAENDSPENGEHRRASEPYRRNSSFAVVIRTPKASPTASEPKTRGTPQASPKVPQETLETSQTLPPSEEKHGVIPTQLVSGPPAAAKTAPETAAVPHVPLGPPPTPHLIPAAQEEPIPHDHPGQSPHVNEMLRPRPPVVERTGRNLTILEDFDEETAQSREYSIYFNAKRLPRLSSMWRALTFGDQAANVCIEISSSLCVITSLPSRYRDTKTYLPYANSYAYREIQRTAAQHYSWSSMLGCYVGPMGIAARGVPERFTNPDAEASRGEGEADRGLDDRRPVETAARPPAAGPGAATPVAAAGAGDAMDIEQTRRE